MSRVRGSGTEGGQYWSNCCWAYRGNILTGVGGGWGQLGGCCGEGGRATWGLLW